MEHLIFPLIFASFILPQAYNTWYGKELWKNFNIGIYSGTNLSRERRKECFRSTFLIFAIIILILSVGFYLN